MTPAEIERRRNDLCALGVRIMKRDGSLPTVDNGSVAWNAWWRWRKDNGLPVAFMESRDQWTVPTEYPPDDLASELSRVGGGKLKDRLQA